MKATDYTQISRRERSRRSYHRRSGRKASDSNDPRGEYPVVAAFLSLTLSFLSLEVHHRIRLSLIRVLTGAGAGKNPVFIDPKTDLKLAAKRILWGRCLNSGQVCLCPEYVLVPEEVQEKLIEHLKEV